MDAQANGKAPSSLSELKKLIDSVDDGENALEFQWLTYIYDSLLARKTYHKKQQVKRKLLMQVATQLLSEDERASIDVQAEDQAAKAGQVEEEG
jgi:hypothetical protein